MVEHEQIGDFIVCQNEQRNPISLRRVSEEVVCLGFDPAHHQLVELHVISDTEQMKRNGKLSFLERGWTAATLESPCFPDILETSEDNGLYYYATDVSEGEFLTDYIVRNGRVEPSTTLAMGLDLVEGLAEVEPHYRLLLGLRLTNLIVVLKDSAYLTLRVIDLGLGRPEPRGMNSFEMSNLLGDVSRQIFYLLSGRPYTVGQLERIDQLAGVDSSVCDLLKKTIEPDSTSIESFEQYQALLEKGYLATARNKPRRSALAASPKTRPRLTVQREIFDRANYATQLKADSFSMEPSSDAFEYPYSVSASKNSQTPGRLSWIPAESVFPDGAGNSALIKKNGFRYRYEPNMNGISLLAFLIARNHRPSAVDSILLLNGLAEALSTKDAELKAFSPHQVWFELPGKSQGDAEEAAKKGVDQWPAVKVRILPATDTAVLLDPLKMPSGATPSVQSQLSYLEVARKLLCEGKKGIHEFMDDATVAIKKGDKYADSGAFLLDLADQIDIHG